MKNKNYIDIRKLEKRLTIFKTIFILINPEKEDKTKRWYNQNLTDDIITKIKKWDKKHQNIRGIHVVNLENEVINFERLEIETLRHEDSFFNYNIELGSPYQPLQEIVPEITQLTTARNNKKQLHYIKIILKWTHIYNREEEE